MGFRWPHRWPAMATDAFSKPTDLEHDDHGFSSVFVAEQDDRDRYLEDYLDQVTSQPPPMVAVSVNSGGVNQTIGSGVWTQLSWPNVDYDTGTPKFYNAGAPSQLLLPSQGLYEIQTTAAFQPTPGGIASVRGIRIFVGGVYVATDQRPALNTAGAWDFLQVSLPLRDPPGNIVTVQVFQNSGGAVLVDGSTAVGQPFLRCALLALG